MTSPLQTVSRIATAVVLAGLLLFAVALGQVLMWGLDRRAPFELDSYTANPARPGDAAIIRASVRRDLSRRCSVTYSRMFFDASGARFDVTMGAQLMNAQALDDLNRRSPDALVLSVTVPPLAAPGMGQLVSVLDYVCNPMHQLYPVAVLMTMDVEVLP